MADGSTCGPVGTTWLKFGFMGEHFYQRFAVVTHMPSSLVLGMNFMQLASAIHIPSFMIANEMKGRV